MKHFGAIILLFLIHFTVWSNNNETLQYSIRLGIMKSGKATISTLETTENGKRIISTEMIVKTTGLAHSLYNVEDTYSCFVDPTTCLPVKSIYKIREQKYKYDDEVFFDQQHDSLYSNAQGSFYTYGDILDLVSLVYNFRFSDQLSGLKKGDLISIPFWDVNNMYTLRLKFSYNEEIKTKAGTFQCVKIEPIFEAGTAYNKKSPLTIWISNDDRKLPVLIQINFKVGSIKCELEDF